MNIRCTQISEDQRSEQTHRSTPYYQHARFADRPMGDLYGQLHRVQSRRSRLGECRDDGVHVFRDLYEISCGDGDTLGERARFGAAGLPSCTALLTQAPDRLGNSH
jgi:hypothetical protein